MSKNPSISDLSTMAAELLDDEGQALVTDFIVGDNIEAAKGMLLTTVDIRFEADDISDTEAKNYYRTLNITPDEAVLIRQRLAIDDSLWENQ